MSNTVIKVENISKKYIINHQDGKNDDNFREMIIGNTKKIITSLNPFSKKINTQQQTKEEFWALKDINFEVNQGDKIGIIGRNGAGKSTLLKVLSRITEPTTGKISIKGRVASLLEVGTGFHPELTGRENIFLNGAILGMSRKEIKSKFDEIVDFSGVEKFLDTPVKRYSSGMYVRLAFAVAAHLEPEILIVDEVLAVGDAEFQKKCLGKMNDVSKEGRTIIFVSHNMNAIENLCNKGIVLNKGCIEHQSNNINNLILKYLNVQNNENAYIWKNKSNDYPHPHFVPIKIWLSKTSNDSTINGLIEHKENIAINIEFMVDKVDTRLAVGYIVYSGKNEIVFVSSSVDKCENDWPKVHRGLNVFKTIIPSHFLNAGDYYIELMAAISGTEMIFEAQNHNIGVVLSIGGKISNSHYWTGARQGPVAPIFKWESV